MEMFIKEEPFEPEFNDATSFQFSQIREPKLSLLEQQFETEKLYLSNLNENIFKNSNENDEDFEYLSKLIKISPISNDLKPVSTYQNASINVNRTKSQAKPNLNQKKSNLKRPNEEDHALNKIAKINITKQIEREKIMQEKKRILQEIIELAKEKNNESLLEKLTVKDELILLKQLNKILKNDISNIEKNRYHAMQRLRAKLELRNQKRLKHIKLFDLDAYVNELIDREKMSIMNEIQKNHPELIYTNEEEQEDEEDDDIIFEEETIKDECTLGAETLAISTRVLDRFKNKKNKLDCCYFNYAHLYSMSIGMLESRFDDIKCVISPYSGKVLKPYVRRDNETYPLKLDIFRELLKRTKSRKFERYPIDYVHLRPEHVIPINIMCRQHFWTGIDVSECLQYPDLTVVVLYRKLIVGFALMVPNSITKQAYLSFIFVHPDWRTIRQSRKNSDGHETEDKNISIAQYMLFYLIQKSSDCDITLHVSVNSPAVIFYQKFGFKIEEYIKNFYDKYYSDDHNLSKDAFLMRLERI